MTLSSMKSFEVARTEAASAVHEGDEDPPGTLVFDIKETDDEGNVTRQQILKAYRPEDGQLAVLMADTARHAERAQVVAGAINFFWSTLDDSGAAYIERRLLDRKDPFGLAEVEHILGWFVEEWTGHPFESSSGATRSPELAGHKSKATTRKSTSSR